ncbi:putative Elongation factor 1-delta [Cocos nucifera]|uniref:Putative Elongation factor 1-delta n=1 Tax=Cocos nucifera TaxID=13894 RepID=A0A8K0I801_COCNU|nr:putative Elongation factor 1-delta [Cocos nucifera]
MKVLAARKLNRERGEIRRREEEEGRVAWVFEGRGVGFGFSVEREKKGRGEGGFRYQASKDDLAVHAALSTAPSLEYVNVARWFNHIDALLKMCGATKEGAGVKIESSASVAEDAPSSPPVAEKAPAAADDDDDDMDLFGEETEEEKKAAEERAAAVKASGKKKETGKSSVLLDVKPWDDETDMQKLEEAVRSVQMEGLLWGASKLAPVGYGIKKLQIMMTIVDDLVSVDSLIEDHLLVEPANEYIQSCDIVAFNKICEYT